MTESLARGGRRRLIATVMTAILAVSGATAIGVAVASQRNPPQSLPRSGDSIEPANPAPSELVSEVASDLPPSEPVAIDIPAIGVHSAVQQLGLNVDGTLEVPAPGPRYDEAAWYNQSPTPGSLGPSIITGHVDSVAGGPSVFFHLGALQPGDSVLVTRKDGVVAQFKVEEVGRYPKDDFPTGLVYGDTDHAALRLITCGGAFDRKSRHYVDNVVAFASFVDYQ